jgi:hypothetical protein
MLIFLGVMPAEVNFANSVQRKRINIAVWVGGLIGRRHKHVVHIQKQAAAGAGDEGELCPKVGDGVIRRRFEVA